MGSSGPCLSGRPHPLRLHQQLEDSAARGAVHVQNAHLERSIREQMQQTANRQHIFMLDISDTVDLGYGQPFPDDHNLVAISRDLHPGGC